MISFDEFCSQSSLFQSKAGRLLAKVIYRVTKLNRIYKIYEIACHESTDDLTFIDSIFRQVGVTVVVDNPEAIRHFSENKVFITVSNHPYGTVDGMALIRIIGNVRSDLKGMTNFMLSKIKPIAGHFIPVNPMQIASKHTSVPGLREAIAHISGGHPLFFFPSGQVSRIVRGGKIADRTWQMPSIRLIQRTKVPVIPIWFSGHNSWYFLLIGLIHPVLRTVFIMSEVFNKHGKTIHIRIGEPVSVEEQSRYTKAEDFGRFLYRKTYELGGI